MSLRHWVVLALVFSAAAASAQTIYTWKDENGVDQFTDNPSNIPEKFRKKAKTTEGADLGTISHTRDENDPEEPAPVAKPTPTPSRPVDDGPSKCVVMKKKISDAEFSVSSQKTEYERRKKYCEQAPASRITRTGRVIPTSGCSDIDGPATLKSKLDDSERQVEKMRDELRIMQHQGC